MPPSYPPPPQQPYPPPTPYPYTAPYPPATGAVGKYIPPAERWSTAFLVFGILLLIPWLAYRIAAVSPNTPPPMNYILIGLWAIPPGVTVLGFFSSLCMLRANQAKSKANERLKRAQGYMQSTGDRLPGCSHLLRSLGAPVAITTIALAVTVVTVNPAKADLAIFSVTIDRTCTTPFNTFHQHYLDLVNKLRQDVGNDAAFVNDLNTYATIFRQDGNTLRDGSNQLKNTAPPDAKYQGLVNDCATETGTAATILLDNCPAPLCNSNPQTAQACGISAQLSLVDGLLVTARLVQDGCGNSSLKVSSGSTSILPQSQIDTGFQQGFTAGTPNLDQERSQLQNDLVAALL